MKVYTKTGDQGETSLFSRERVFKDDPRVEVYGTVDEANAAMGLAKSFSPGNWAAEIIERLQAELILLNADIATKQETAAIGRIGPAQVSCLEHTIDELEKRRIPQRYFVSPGLSSAGAALDLARTIIRRAERKAVGLSRSGEQLSPDVLLYLNRLSDLLYVLARCVEQEDIISLATRRILAVLNGQSTENKAQPDQLLTAAKRILEAAEAKAWELGVPMVIAVVDNGGNLVAQHRMDQALLASLSLALDKAYTAVALKMPTGKAAALTQPGQPLFGLNTSHQGRLIVFGGGIPLARNGEITGGIGVSGGSVEEDCLVAQAGVAAWQDWISQQ